MSGLSSYPREFFFFPILILLLNCRNPEQINMSYCFLIINRCGSICQMLMVKAIQIPLLQAAELWYFVLQVAVMIFPISILIRAFLFHKEKLRIKIMLLLTAFANWIGSLVTNQKPF